MTTKRKPSATPDGVKVTRKITDFQPDASNANKHTLRGTAMLEDSLRELGAGRSILVDRNGLVIAGNATQQAAVDAGIEDAIVVPTDGRQLVVVQRTDIDLDSPAGRRMAISDNRIGQVNLDFDGAELEALLAQGIDLATYFDDDELAALTNVTPDFQPVGIDEQGRLDQKKPITCPHCGKEFTPGE